VVRVYIEFLNIPVPAVKSIFISENSRNGSSNVGTKTFKRWFPNVSARLIW